MINQRKKIDHDFELKKGTQKKSLQANFCSNKKKIRISKKKLGRIFD